MATTFHFENNEQTHIIKSVDGIEDGRYIPIGSIYSQEFQEYGVAFDANLVTTYGQTTRGLLSNKYKAKSLRDTSLDLPITVLGVEWDIDKTSRENLRTAIETAGRNPSRADAQWVLRDNSVRVSTKADLEAVMDAYAFRMESIFTQYTIWRSGSMTNPFVLT